MGNYSPELAALAWGRLVAFFRDRLGMPSG